VNAIIQHAGSVADQAELYTRTSRSTQIQFTNGSLSLVAHNDRTEAALRVLVKGKLGAAFGDPVRGETLVHDAVSAAAYGQDVPFTFSGAQSIESQGEEPQIQRKRSAQELVTFCAGINQRIRSICPDADANLSFGSTIGSKTVQTTAGTDVTDAFSHESLIVEIPFQDRGTDIGAAARLIDHGDLAVSDVWLEDLLEMRTWGSKPSAPSTGRLPTLLTPYASNLLLIALAAGLNGLAIAQGASPLAGKIGESILSPKLTIREDPGLGQQVSPRRFDDEGVPVQARDIVSNGVLRSYLTDLGSSGMLEASSTGNAVRRTLFTETIQDVPGPAWLGAVIEPGPTGWKELLAGMEEGILVTRMLGLHSSNLLQGQYAVQATGFHVRNGKPIGYLERTMISGNVFEDFGALQAVSSELEPIAQEPLSVPGLVPYLLLESVQATVG